MRSSGAVHVRAMAPAPPPAKKSCQTRACGARQAARARCVPRKRAVSHAVGRRARALEGAGKEAHSGGDALGDT